MKKNIASTTSNQQPLRALIVDDSEDDVLLIIRELKKGGYNPVYERVETAGTMEKSLKDKQWDIILCDYKMPNFSAPSAIALLKKVNIDIPIIIISGAIGEETAVECMRQGAQDYIMKGNFSRLCPAISRELEETKARNKQKQTESQKEAALDARQESEEKYRTILENIEDGYYETDLAGNFTFFNDSLCRIHGYSKEELMGMNYRQYEDKESLKKVFQTYNKVYNTGKPIKGFDRPIIRKDGTKRYIEVSISLLKDSSDKSIGFRGITREITERKQMEEELRQSEGKYRTILENMQESYYELDLAGNFTFVNNTVCRHMGYSKDELIGMNYRQYTDKEDLQRVFQAYSKVYLTGEPFEEFCWQIIKKDGTKMYIEGSASLKKDSGGKPIGFKGIDHDITDRKKAEEELRKSEEKYRNILENIEDSYYEVDLAGNLTFFNDSLCRLYGFSKEELMGMNNRQYADKETSKEVFQAYHKVYSTGEPTKEVHWQAIRKDGTKRYIEASASLQKDSSGKPIGFRGIIRDITERKQAEEALKESEKKYRLLADNIDDVLFVLDMNLIYTYASPSVKTLMGYEPEELLKLRLPDTVMPSSWDMALKTFSEIMEMETSGNRRINNPLMIQLEMKRKDGSTVWTEVRASFIRDENQQPVGIISVSRDITERKLTGNKLQQTLDSLRKAFGATIQVMVSAVEIRDPYTAGHQARTADIARAIAEEMGLDQDKIDGIRMASTIHDIGKLSIPAEILSKPTKLTNIEYSLIKEHSQIGYEILKDIESPWPLAEIVYQHHERMNGSGYPRNLKGDEILMEARIMAVADVVEAMASHRPYRAALGIEVALEEIEKNRGVFYDDAVVDACLTLFREKGYQLP